MRVDSLRSRRIHIQIYAVTARESPEEHYLLGNSLPLACVRAVTISVGNERAKHTVLPTAASHSADRLDSIRGTEGRRNRRNQPLIVIAGCVSVMRDGSRRHHRRCLDCCLETMRLFCRRSVAAQRV